MVLSQIMERLGGDRPLASGLALWFEQTCMDYKVLADSVTDSEEFAQRVHRLANRVRPLVETLAPPMRPCKTAQDLPDCPDFPEADDSSLNSPLLPLPQTNSVLP